MSDPKSINSSSLWGLERLSQHLSFHTRRQEVIASNLANIDTPGYRAKDLKFQEIFTINQNTGEQSAEFSQEVYVQDDEVPDQDGNTVSLENQMARSTANLLRYRSLGELLSRKVGLLKYAANDGK